MTEPLNFDTFNDLELVRVIHDLRTHPEDKVHLDAALQELRTREQRRFSQHMLNAAAKTEE